MPVCPRLQTVTPQSRQPIKSLYLQLTRRYPGRLCFAMSIALFSPFTLRKLKLANRIVVSPMCQYSAVDGCATDWHSIHWGQMLQSGAGMFTIEATAESAIGRLTCGCLGLYDDACEQALGDRLAVARDNAPS